MRPTRQTLLCVALLALLVVLPAATTWVQAAAAPPQPHGRFDVSIQKADLGVREAEQVEDSPHMLKELPTLRRRAPPASGWEEGAAPVHAGGEQLAPPHRPPHRPPHHPPHPRRRSAHHPVVAERGPMRRWERQEAASPGANADVVAVPLGEPVVYSHRRQRAVQRAVAAAADGDGNDNAPLPPPPQVEGCDESPKAQIGTIIDGRALTGFVVVVAMAVVLLGLIVVEAVPMAIDWVRSRREEKKNVAAEKEGLESVAPNSNAV